jgi:chromosome segregation ATPase
MTNNIDDLLARSMKMREAIGKRVNEIVEQGEKVEDEVASLREQVQRLADFIMMQVPGEPSKSQGAVDTAIRVIEEQKTTIDTLKTDKAELADRLSVISVSYNNTKSHYEQKVGQLMEENERWEKLYTTLEASYDRMRQHLWSGLEPQQTGGVNV